MKKCKTGGMTNSNKKVTPVKSATKYTGGKNPKAAVKPSKGR